MVDHRQITVNIQLSIVGIMLLIEMVMAIIG